MRRRSAILAAGLVVTVVVGWWAWRVLHEPVAVEAPPPLVSEDVDEAPAAPPPSTVDAPILYDLAPAIAALEAAVPRTFGDIGARQQAGGNRRLEFAFSASRTPFAIAIDGFTVRISTVIEYAGRGWYHPVIGPEISAACGTGGVERPRLRATLTSRVTLNPDWSITTRTRLSELKPVTESTRDRCRVTVFRIDVTSRVMDAARSALAKQLATLDRNVASVDTRSRFESWWRRLQLPIRLADSIYLTINPLGAQLDGIESNDRTLIANVRLLVQPRVVTGPRPNDFALMKPIPNLTFGTSDARGLEIFMEGTFTYPVATSLLRKAVRGKSVIQGGRSIVIRDVRLLGIGDRRVALGVDLGGAVRGRVYFTGTPVIDTATRQVAVPDLDYDVGSSNLLVQGLDWLRGDDLRDLLRTFARFPDAQAIGRLVPLAERGMNRQLADGVVLRASIHEARGVSVRATTRDLRVYAEARGTARLAISKEIAPAAGKAGDSTAEKAASVRK